MRRRARLPTDPWDESNWPLANPALGDFLSIRSLRQEAEEAKNDPSKENAFRQYRLNQWVQQSHRWMPMHLYRQCAGTVAPAPDWLRAELAGRRAYGGLDLAAKLDMTAWALLIPDGLDGIPSMLWRFWLPESAVHFLDGRTNGRVSQWAEGGWITVTPGDVIDYDVIYADMPPTAATSRSWPPDTTNGPANRCGRRSRRRPGSTSRRSRRPTAASPTA